jgi:peptidyl-tRNA hydrolase
MNKLYIVVDEQHYQDNPGLAITSVAHASMIAKIKWGHDMIFTKWANDSFKKVVVLASSDTMTQLMAECNAIHVTESALNDARVSIVVHPSDCNHPILPTLKLIE